MHKFDLAAILSTLVGVSALAADSSFQAPIVALAGSHAPHVLSILSLVGLVGGQVLRVLGAPSGSLSVSLATYVAPSAVQTGIIHPAAPASPPLQES